jgi:hypothetical protein
MKCSKCGFISFDHLSACKKCGANLSHARSGLGFTEAVPSPPAFLKGLPEEGGSPVGDTTRKEIKSASTPGSRPEAQSSHGTEFSMGNLSSGEAPPRSLDADEDTEEWAIDSQWLEELDEPATPEFIDSDDLVLELVDDEGASMGNKPDLSLGSSRGAGPDQRGRSLELNLDESLEDMFLEDFSIESGGAPAAGQQTKSAEPVPTAKTGLALGSLELDENVDDLVMDLTDDDQDALAIDLEDSPIGGKKPSSAA